MTEHPSDPTTADLLVRLATLEAEVATLKAQASDAAGRPSVSQSGTPAREPAASRRDLLRYGAVAIGAAAAGLAARPAEAADGNPMVIGNINLGTRVTQLNSSGPISLFASSEDGHGLLGQSHSTSGIGVIGLASASSGATQGVKGQCFSPDGSAVHGLNEAGGTAVLGEVPGTTSANGIAVAGVNNSSFAGTGPGGGGLGVYGHSRMGHGVVGATGTAGAVAIFGATNDVAGAYAGVFFGPVVVKGNLTVTGAKSAAVPHADGTHRLVYCVESPESWFEDFGSATLACGRAEVSIDPGFAEVADLDDYHVFLTGYDHDHLLHVMNRTPQAFTVHADVALAALKGQAKDQLSGSFSWRVVARRKDIRSERLTTVTIPPAPTLPDIPLTSEPPAFEGLGRRR